MTTEVEVSPSQATPQVQEEAPRRRRGRPRKVDVQAAALAATQDAPTESVSAPAAPAAGSSLDSATQAEGAPAPRRRGRPRKVDQKAAEDLAATPSPAEKASAKEAAPASESLPAPVPEAEKPSSAAVLKEDAQQSPARSERSYRNSKGSEKSHDSQRGYQKKNQRNNRGQNNDKYQQRRSRKSYASQHQMAPSVTKEDLEKLKVAELRAKADELGVSHTGLKKAELVEVVLAASIKAEGFIEVEGILDTLADGYGFIRTQGYLPSEQDVYVALALIRRNHLRKGDKIKAQIRPARENEKYGAVQQILTVNDTPLDELGKRVRFADLTPVFPDERLLMEHGKQGLTARVIDLSAPIGKGQRGLIVSPPKAGKTTILKDIAAAISANNPEVHLMCLLVDERPEEVTDMERSIKGEVISSTFDMPCENHIAVAEMVIERAKRMVENGADVVILLDSLTRLARAYNLAQPASGRILSGGVDSTALYPPKRFLGAARNIEGGGSLTILASALIDTGSKMDEVIFEEFKGTGNMELKLDRYLADRRIFPAIDPIQSGTRKEDLLLNPQEAPLIWAVRRILANMNNTERAMDMLIKSLKQTDNNEEFLLRTAKKAQSSASGASTEISTL